MSESGVRRDDQLPWQLWFLAGTIVAIELWLSASDRGWIDPEWRTYAFLNGAFWRPVATGAVAPLFDEQWLTMYVSHAFLHGGIVHVALNSTVLLALGKHIAARTGPWVLLALFVVSAVAGALGFQILSNSNAPMVGASGAVFGFLGLWLYWDFIHRRRLGLPITPVLKTVLGLVAANVLIYFAFSGTLAWEAHLGGFVAGVVVGPLIPRNSFGFRAGFR